MIFLYPDRPRASTTTRHRTDSGTGSRGEGPRGATHTCPLRPRHRNPDPITERGPTTLAEKLYRARPKSWDSPPAQEPFPRYPQITQIFPDSTDSSRDSESVKSVGRASPLNGYPKPRILPARGILAHPATRKSTVDRGCSTDSSVRRGPKEGPQRHRDTEYSLSGISPKDSERRFPLRLCGNLLTRRTGAPPVDRSPSKKVRQKRISNDRIPGCSSEIG